METPFEKPHTALENAPPARHTRVLRPYLDTLIAHDAANPVHSNPYNRFNMMRDAISEDTLEYWMSDNENNNENESDSDLSSDSNVRNKRRRIRKRRKLKNSGIVGHDTMVRVPGTDPSYEFNSNEIVHLKQQMFLSLLKRSKSRQVPRNKAKLAEYRKNIMTLPTNVKTKDINTALIALSGYEKSVEKTYFNNLPSMNNVTKVSFIKYLSHAINNLFYISLYNQQWENCYKLFGILLKTFDTDILQIWPLGVHILTQLNTEQFKKNFVEEWNKNYSSIPTPQIPLKIYHDMAFLQNPNLVEPLINDTTIASNEKIIHILKRTVVRKRSMQETIFNFLKLLIRTSRNQFPLIGAFPEQIYVPGGIISHGIDGETDYDTQTQTQTETETEANSARSSVAPTPTPSTDEEDADEEEDFDISSDSSIDSQEVYKFPTPTTNPQTSSSSESESSSDSETEAPKSQLSSLIIKKTDFNPMEDTRQPFQHNYRTLLTTHSTPTHRHGTRKRTPTYTLSYLWLLVRAGNNAVLQKAIDSMLLVVPTSIDARVALADIMSKMLDVVAEIQKRKDADDDAFNKWEMEESIRMKMGDVEDSWARWKDQFTSKRKKKRKGVRQFSDYECVYRSIENLKKWVEVVLKDSGKKKTGGDSSDSSDSDEENDEDAEEIREEMERLLSYSAGNGENDEEDEEIDDEDDEEVQREMERLMGYSEAIDDEFAEREFEDDDRFQFHDNFQTEEEQFVNEYVTQDGDNGSDSE